MKVSCFFGLKGHFPFDFFGMFVKCLKDTFGLGKKGVDLGVLGVPRQGDKFFESVNFASLLFRGVFNVVVRYAYFGEFFRNGVVSLRGKDVSRMGGQR